MPNTKRSDIFTVIKSLSKAEKRYFRLFLGRTHPGKATKFDLLFDAIDALPHFDDTTLAAALPAVDKRHLPNLKSRLYERLLQSLRLYHAGSTPAMKIRANLESAEVLYQKGLFEPCWRLLEKTKEIAYAAEKIHSLPEIINWQKTRLALRVDKSNSREPYRALVDEERSIQTRLFNTIAAETFNSQVYGVFIKVGRVVRDRSLFNSLNDDVATFSQKYHAGDVSFWEGVYLSQGLYQFHQMNADFESSCSYAEQRLAAFNSKAFLQHEEPVLYNYVLNHLAISQMVLGRYTAARASIERIRSFGRKVKRHPGAPSLLSVYETANFLELEVFLRQGKFDEALAVVEQILPRLASYDKAMHNVNKYSKFYRIALAYFCSGQADEALSWVNQIINAGDVVSRTDIYISVRLLSLLIHYELGHIDLLDYLADTYQRSFIRLDCLYPSEQIFLNFCKRAPLLSDKSKHHEALLQTRAQLAAAQQAEELECYAFAYFDLYSWLTSRLTGESYAAIISRKQRLEVPEIA